MIQRAIPATLVALCTALPGYGADLTLSLGATGEYDSNVFRSPDDEEDDFIFTIRPGLRLHEDRGDDVNYSLRYIAPVEISTQYTDELNDVDHILDGNAEYRVNERVTVGLQDTFRYLRSTLRDERDEPDDVATGQGVPTLSTERDRVTLNNGSVYLNYLMSPRWVVRGTVRGAYFDSSRDDRAENYLVGTVVDSLYRWSQQHQIGGGARYSFQEFEDRLGIAGSHTHTVGLFGSWRWIFDETTTLSVTAGPALLISEQEDAASSFRTAPVFFQNLPNATLNGTYFDSQGGALTDPQVNRGDILVPSFLTDTMAPNCPTANLNGAPQFVAPCPANVVLFGADLQGLNDENLIQAITGGSNDVFVTNVDAGGEDSEEVTIFAEVVFSKRWSPTLVSAFRYSREQGNASGLGGTVVGDSVSLSTTWDFAERWQLALRGDWIQRESVFKVRQTRIGAAGIDPADLGVPGGTSFDLAGPSGTAFNSSVRTSIDTNRWSVGGRVTHRLFRHTQLFGQVRYDEQTSDAGTLGRDSDFENVLAVIGVRHSFEPIKLW